MIYSEIYDILVADNTLTAGLATYNGAPAIFTSGIIPSDATCTYITIESVGAGIAELAESRCKGGWTEEVGIRLIQNKTYSLKSLNALSNRIFTLLHRKKVTNGFLISRGDLNFYDKDGFPGILRIVTAHLWEI